MENKVIFASFFHDAAGYDKEKNIYIIDLSRKILIFLDQPHNQLLERLRPILSHDKKEIRLKNKLKFDGTLPIKF